MQLLSVLSVFRCSHFSVVRSAIHADPPCVLPPRHASARHVVLFVHWVHIFFLKTLGLHLTLVPFLGFHFALVLSLGLNFSLSLSLAQFAPPQLSPLSPVFLAPPEHSLLFLAPHAPPALSSPRPLAPPALSSFPLAPHAPSSRSPLFLTRFLLSPTFFSPFPLLLLLSRLLSSSPLLSSSLLFSPLLSSSPLLSFFPPLYGKNFHFAWNVVF